MRAGALLALALTAATPGAAALAQGDANDAAIDARIRASAEAAESLQGPLDGGWTLVAASGQALYAFQFVDKPGGQDPPEGVWRDLRRPAGPGDIGPIDSLARGPGVLTLSFAAKPGQPAVAVELKSSEGGWSGRLHEAGVAINVMMRRN